MNELTQTSANTEPQLLSEEGGIKLRDFNPKAILRFTGRKCITCGNEILDHWLIYDTNVDMRGFYWCDKSKKQWSEGIADCQFDLNGVQMPKENPTGETK